ncbi:MAG: RadC family protein [Gemmatimonadaceae bacterium]
MSGVAIRELPSTERPRERLKQHGPHALSAIELMAILFGSGSEGRSSIDLARDVLGSSQGSLRRLASRPVASLTTVKGVGSARAIVVHAALELGRRMVAEQRDEGAAMREARDVYNAYAHRLEDLPVEEFHVATLDAQHRLENDILVTRGILNSSLVHAREVFRQAIAENAYAVILIHNHPSGDPTPSPEDRAVTTQLVSAGKLLGIEVLDHIVVGRGRFTSFAESGLLV